MRITSSPWALSRLPVGSSASSSAGRDTMARAMATRCCWPPDNSAGVWPSQPPRPTACKALVAAVRRTAAAQALQAVGLGGWEQHTPAELSGGQQQRVAIARAIVTEPAVVLADEPTGNLDTQRSHEIMGLLMALNKDHGITVLMVTHEPDMAAYAHRMVHFVDGLIARDEPNAHPTLAVPAVAGLAFTSSRARRPSRKCTMRRA